MEIVILGTGYVGLVTAACLADMGHKVTCFDIDTHKISLLEQGIIPFYEPRLQEIVERNVVAGRLIWTSDLGPAIMRCPVCMITVPTPSYPDGSCDLSFVLQAATAIASHMTQHRLIVIKSTVPVGTSVKVREVIASHLQTPVTFDVVSNPEFLKEGAAVDDCMKPDRIIIGVETPQAAQVMKELYLPFSWNHNRILITDPASAEMIKYAANSMLATRISFMNEIATLCERLGVDIHAVRQGIGADPRIGYHFLYAGVGYGGSCFPKDLRALQAMGRDLGCPTPLIAAVEMINQRQKELLVHKIEDYFRHRGAVAGKTVAIWGLSFKPETDDLREAPSLTIIDGLLNRGAHLRLYDPIAMPKAQELFTRLYTPAQLERITWCRDAYDAAATSHAVALVTEWKQFRSLQLDQLRNTMLGKGFFDGRNQYPPHEMRAKGFDYTGIGIAP